MHAIIFSMEAEVWNSDAAWEHFDETCHLDNNIPRDRVRVAFGLDSCHRGMLSITDSNGLTQVAPVDTDFGNLTLTDSWVNVGMDVSNNNGVATVSIHGSHSDAWSSTQAMTITLPNMKWTHDALSTLHVGSFLGTTKFTAGRMFDL
jgi:hypothetical protein